MLFSTFQRGLILFDQTGAGRSYLIGSNLYFPWVASQEMVAFKSVCITVVLYHTLVINVSFPYQMRVIQKYYSDDFNSSFGLHQLYYQACTMDCEGLPEYGNLKQPAR